MLITGKEVKKPTPKKRPGTPQNSRRDGKSPAW